jgi:tripartite-type tricarboxylate transporter receptor subunit TctC
VTTVKRLPALPEVPAIAEFVPGYEATIYVGIAAPRSTPVAIVDKLSQQIVAADADPQITARIAQLGDTVLALPSAAFAKLVVAETQKWDAVIKSAGIRAE